MAVPNAAATLEYSVSPAALAVSKAFANAMASAVTASCRSRRVASNFTQKAAAARSDGRPSPHFAAACSSIVRRASLKAVQPAEPGVAEAPSQQARQIAAAWRPAYSRILLICGSPDCRNPRDSQFRKPEHYFY